MRQSILEPLQIKFEQPNWSKYPALALIDTVLEQHPELITNMESDFCDFRAKMEMKCSRLIFLPSTVEKLVRHQGR